MAKTTAVIAALASATGRDSKSLINYADQLRKAGTLPPTKRGPAAVEATSAHAKGLLLGAMGTNSPSRAAEVSTRLSSLRKSWSTKDAAGPFKTIAAGETLGDAVVKMIETAPAVLAKIDRQIHEAFPAREAAAWKKSYRVGPWSGPSTLTLSVGRCSASVVATATVVEGGLVGVKTIFEAHYVADADLFLKGFYGPDGADLKQVTSITGYTLLKLYEALNDDGQRAGA